MPQEEDVSALDNARTVDPYVARMRIVRGDETMEVSMSLSDPLPVEDE